MHSFRRLVVLKGRRTARSRSWVSWRVHKKTFSSTQSNHNDSSTPDWQEQARLDILTLALEKVHTHGWTEDAIAAATAQAQYPLSLVGMISKYDLIGHCMDQWNRHLQTHLKENLFDNLKLRLECCVPYVKSGQWHHGMALGLQTPWQTKGQLEELVKLAVGSTWTASPSSHQLALVGAIYAAAELHLLSDTSVDYQDTWQFLKSRVDEYESGSVVLPHVNSDTVYVASTIASSLLSGAVSVLQPSNLHLPNIIPGTHPSHYNDNKAN